MNPFPFSFRPETVPTIRTTSEFISVLASPNRLSALLFAEICAEAGLSLDSTLQRVADEMINAAPQLSEEFGLTAAELSFLPDRTTALSNLKERVDLPAMRGLVNSLVQSERYGTPLAQSLRVLASESRHERVMKAEEKAQPKELYVALSSDRGLCGGIHSSICKTIRSELLEKSDLSNVGIVCVGDKSRAQLGR